MAIHYAHLTMLAAQGIVSAADAHRLRAALDSVSLDEVRRVKYDGSCEDLFFYVEHLILTACGDAVAGRLHTARSRNDIDMTMYRMRQREFILGLLAATFALRRTQPENEFALAHPVHRIHSRVARGHLRAPPNAAGARRSPPRHD